MKRKAATAIMGNGNVQHSQSMGAPNVIPMMSKMPYPMMGIILPSLSEVMS